MQKRAFAALLLTLGCVTLSTASFAQPSAAPPRSGAATPFSAQLVGKPAISWVIGKKYWTNTAHPVWLGGLKGHVTVIEFFRSKCSHCQEAAPSRRALYLKYRGQGLKMVGFQSPGDINDPQNVENDWPQVKRTIREWQLPYPIAFDSKRALFDQYGLGFYPTAIVLDRQGIVRFQQTGYDEAKARQLEEFIDKALTEGS